MTRTPSMVAAPLFSTFTLLTEIVITTLVLYIFYAGYYKNHFPYKIAGFALAYEIIFNISYMAYRSFLHVANESATSAAVEVETPFQTGLAIFHGIISLVMFIALVVFLIVAWKNYKNNVNYFKKHKAITLTFIIFWLIAVISGIAFYFIIY